MRNTQCLALLLTAVVMLSGRSLAAQSVQRISLQASGATLFATTANPGYESTTRLGFEGQLRYTFGRFSVGAGYQRSTVFSFAGNPLTLALSLGFVEPRYVVTAGQTVALYVAGRIGAGKLICSQSGNCAASKTNLSYGGGGGLLFRLNRRLSADLGAQYFGVNGNFSSSYALVRLGLGVGL